MVGTRNGSRLASFFLPHLFSFSQNAYIIWLAANKREKEIVRYKEREREREREREKEEYSDLNKLTDTIVPSVIESSLSLQHLFIEIFFFCKFIVYRKIRSANWD